MSKEIKLLKELETHVRNTILEGTFIEPLKYIFPVPLSEYEEFRVESCYIGGLESILEELDEIRSQKEQMED
jgi:hypothetical protein